MKNRTGIGSLAIFIGLVALALGPQLVQAQEYPTKPVTLVIPFGAGGSHDLTARTVTSVGADHLGSPHSFNSSPVEEEPSQRIL